MSTEDVTMPYFCGNILQKLNEMRKGSVLTDVILICGERKFAAHRCHLSAASEYLYNMFNSGLKECSEGTVEFPTIEPSSLEIILDILYTGRLPYVGLGQLRNLLVAAHLMHLQEVFFHYRDILLSQFCINNFTLYWELGETLDDDAILNQVYENIEEIYLQPEFETISKISLKKLVQHLLEQESFHDLLLKIIMKWTNGGVEQRLTDFEELVAIIDLKRLSNKLLLQVSDDPLISESDVFKRKFEELAANGIDLRSKLLEKNHLPSSIMVFGYDGTNCVVQKCFMGEWYDTNINLQPIKTENAALVLHKSQFHIVAKQFKNFQYRAFLTVFDKKGRKLRCINLGTIVPNARLIAIEGKTHFVAIAYSPYRQDNFLCVIREKLVISNFFMCDSKIKRAQLLSSNQTLFQIIQDEDGNGLNELHILKFSEETYTWDNLYDINWMQKSPNWFAYFMEPHYVVLREFSGETLQYNIESGEVQIKQDNNRISDVVSVILYEDKVGCLTEDGYVYFQNAADGKSEWILATKSPVALQKYKQLIISPS